MKTPNWSWDDDRVEELKRQWRLGHSAGQISKIFGITRNAVIGKVHRLGLSSADQARRIPRAPREKNPRNVGNNVVRKRRSKPMRPEPTPVITAHARPWTERGFGQCAYPLVAKGADTASCCAPVWKATPYCPAHFNAVYDARRAA